MALWFESQICFSAPSIYNYVLAPCVYEVTQEDNLDDEDKTFPDGTAKLEPDGSLVFDFDEPKSPSEVILQLKGSPEVTVSLKDEEGNEVKSLVRQLLAVKKNRDTLQCRWRN